MTGGFTGSENTKSTEMFSDFAWRMVGLLPRARNGLRATTLNNIVYLLGKSFNGIQSASFEYSKAETLKFCSLTPKMKLGITSIK